MTGARYRAAPPEALLVRPLDDLVAIYHRASGRTHVVTTPVPELLEALTERALTANDLLRLLADRYDLADADADRLIARLAELEDAGLVTRV